MRRSIWWAVGAAGLLPCADALGQEEDDAWSAPITLRGPSGLPSGYQDGYLSPIHVALLPDGQVMLIGKVRPNPDGGEEYGFTARLDPTPVGEEPAAELWPEMTHVPYDYPPWSRDELGGQPWLGFDSLFCAGHTFTSDGRFLTVGGTRFGVIGEEGATAEVGWGLPYAMQFDADLDVWTRIRRNMSGDAIDSGEALRWYPSATRLADGRILVMDGLATYKRAGLADLEGLGTRDRNQSAEIYDPETDQWELLSVHPDLEDPPAGLPVTPWQAWGWQYPHVFQLPEVVHDEQGDYEILMFGNAGVPVLFAPGAAEPWRIRAASPRPGVDLFDGVSNEGSSSAMLPLRLADGEAGYANGSVLVEGSICMVVGDVSPADTHIDLYDPVADQWHASLEMGIGRHHGAMVLLPDGNVVVFGGLDDCVDPTTPELGRAQYVDPFDGFALSLGADQAVELVDGVEQPEVHGYHMVAALLPDGRVLVGGGRYGGRLAERPSFRYYSPPYMAQPRPELVAAPAAIAYGTDFTVRSAQAAEIREAVLVGLASMTHSFDFDQRHVQIEVRTSSDGELTLVAPASHRWAPPGPYLLFVLDGARVPSIGSIVMLGDDGALPCEDEDCEADGGDADADTDGDADADAGPDGPDVDGGGVGTPPEGGCGCVLARRSDERPGLLLLVLLVLPALRRRGSPKCPAPPRS